MANNLHKHATSVKKEAREKIKGHQGAVVWFTGLSGSGKSTIANELDVMLNDMGLHTALLDGDNVRQGLNKDLGFSDEDRVENIRRIGETAKLMADSGLIVLTAFISPFKADRKIARDIIGDNFVEVFVDCSLDVCEKRDPKGLYKKARAGIIPNFTGIDSPYEAPEAAELRINTDELGPTACANIILAGLESEAILGSKPIDNLDKRLTIALDFDGVIHKYSKGFQGTTNAYDPPNKGTEEAMQEMIKEGFQLKVMTSRPAWVVRQWLKEYNLDQYIDEVTNHKIPATVYIDDRGFCFKTWKQCMNELYEHPKMWRNTYVAK